MLLDFSENLIPETYDLYEDGHVVSMTVEHATQQTNVDEFSYERASA